MAILTAPPAYTIIEGILKQHNIPSDKIIWDFFVECDSKGVPSGPVIGALTPTCLVLVRRGFYSHHHRPQLDYDVLSLSKVRLVTGCVHHQTLVVQSEFHEIYYLQLSHVGHSRADGERRWDVWTEAVAAAGGGPLPRFSRERQGERYGLRGTLALGSRLEDPFTEHTYVNTDAYAFDHDAFNKWLFQPQHNVIEQTSSSSFPSSAGSTDDCRPVDSLQDFLCTRTWGQELKTNRPVVVRQPPGDENRLLHFYGHMLDERRGPKDDELEEAMRTIH